MKKLQLTSLWLVPLQAGALQGLDEDVFDHIPGHIGQAVVSPRVTEREPGVIESKTVENGRVEVVNMALVLDRLHAEIVGLAASDPAFDAATR